MAASRDRILRDAEKLVQKGKLDQAIREYEKLLKNNPNDPNTINRVGDLYGRVGQVDKAVELYERIADHFTQDGFTTKAIAILKKINRLAPQRLDIFDQLAELYIQQGLVVEAKAQYRMLVDWYLKNGDLERAVTTQEKLVQLDPNNHMAHLRQADLLMQAERPEDALAVYDNLGKVLLEREKLDEAERLYRHALDQDPPHGEFVAPLCEALLDAGRTTVAREFIHAGLQRSPSSQLLRALEVRVLVAFGEIDAALGKADDVLSDRPDDHRLRAVVVNALVASGDAEKARETVLPSAEKMLDRGEFGAAQRLLAELLTSLPDDRAVLNLAVRAYRPAGDDEMLHELVARLADSYFEAGEHEPAQRLYVELLEAQPKNNAYRERLATIQSVEPDQVIIAAPAQEEAVLVPPRAEMLTPAEPPQEPRDAPASAVATGEFDPDERLAEAKVFAKYGLLEKATAHLEEIIRSYPDRMEARAILVSLYVEQDDKRSALTVARPLVDHYRTVGDGQAVETLLNSLPELSGREEPTEGADEDVVVLLDLDDTPEEARPAETEGAAARADDLPEVSFDEEEFVIDLDALEGPAAEETIPQTAEPAPLAPTATDEDGSEELVEISESFDGPPVADLDQLDFFIDQALHEDAMRLLGRLEEEFPGHPEVTERRLALKAKGVLLEEVVAGAEEPEQLFADEEESYIDLAKELERELAEEEAMVDEATGRGKEEAILEEVFREFQKGVAEQLSESDSDTHFNLGIAYKEMGLLPEAIREFQVSSRDAKLFVECCSLIGICYVEQGMWSEAAGWYEKALDSPDISGDAELALRYDLGTALESAGDHDRAMDMFELIAAADPGYRDVADRLSSLSEHRQAN